MNALCPTTVYSFREKSGREPSGHQPDLLDEIDDQKRLDDEDCWLVCRQCRLKIAKTTDRAVVNGSHRHTFANPNGIVFEIGCFGQARGCNGYGPPSTEFTWFAGYSWRIVLCGKCLTHLGWVFTSSSPGHFYGLILDRLVETDTSLNP